VARRGTDGGAAVLIAAVLLLVGCTPADPTGGEAERALSNRPSVGATSPPDAHDAPRAGPSTPPAASRATTPARPSPAVTSTRPALPLHGRVIVIDPGHNGGNGQHVRQIARLVNAGGFKKQCNTVGSETRSGYLEATFNWDVARRLATLLRARGARVILTRTGNDGWGPCVNARGRLAARNHADLLVSIHADGAAASDQGFHVISPARLEGYTDKTRARSARLARQLRDAMVAAGFTRSTYAGHRGLAVRRDLGTLNLAHSPAAMIECGNMRNVHDASVIESPTGRARIALALADGIGNYLG
jgi:N-acetylmuramoyl-L-alanine amidase